MTVYAVEYTYVDDEDALNSTRPEHRSYLRGLFTSGQLLASGPFIAAGGALLLLRVPDRGSLDVLLANDPFARANLIVQTDVREWNPVIGPWDE